jgi:hypothetical protein
MKHLFFIFISLFFLSCKPQDNKSIKNNEQITSISISTYGGEMGYMQNLKITQDSLYYNFNLMVDPAKKRSGSKLNSSYKLENLISKKQLASFSKTNNGKSRQPVDGTDTKIVIETKQKTLTVINAEGNVIWSNIETKLNEIINKEFQ